MSSESKGGIVKAIDVNTVHKICSGQVVLTLAVAVKELVENSLDSHASAVEVKLKDHGSEMVEVSDNGHGITEENFESLCLKHYTSKLEDFEDLLNVETFGFRGEALSSLCALSKLSVTTCEKGKSIGWKLEYDNQGKLVQKNKYSRQVGTTVTLCNLFSTLPVRHKEFIRNLKREFSKMVNLLTGYCLISTGKRITCTNITTGGKQSVILSTRGGNDLKDNISLIFGLKSIQNMLKIPTIQPSEEILAEFFLNPDIAGQMDSPFNLIGYLSSCSHGQGRSCADRQYYFINGRPCDPSKIIKLVNEIYHSYNRHQYPCIVLNIVTRSHEIDINVTPDKRQLMVVNEKLLLATIKASLMDLYRDIPSTFSLQNTSLTVESPPKTQESPSVRTSLAAFAARGSPKPLMISAEKRKQSSSFSPAPKQKRLDQYVTVVPNASQMINEVSTPETNSVKIIESLEELDSILDEIPVAEPEILQVSAKVTPAPVTPLKTNQTVIPFDLDQLKLTLDQHRNQNEEDNLQESKRFLARINPDDGAAAEAELSRQISQHDFEKMEVVGQFNLGFIIARLRHDLFIVDQHAADEKHNFETLQRTTKLKPQKLVCPKPLNLTAVNESLLMENVEIFRSNGFDFLIKNDEEATHRVSLSAVPMSGNWLFGPGDVDELLFLLQDSSPADGSQEISQASMARYRPSRVRAMFASRACRKAVMVGDPLTPPLMKKLLLQLGLLQQPWSCPHGRPTMRHLINLSMLK